MNFHGKQTPDVAELVLLFISHYAKYDFNHISLHLHNASVIQRNQFSDTNASCASEIETVVTEAVYSFSFFVFSNNHDQQYVSIFDPYASTTICRVKGGADLLSNAFQATKKAMLAGHYLGWPVSMN
ncbi:unnamed protein product [Gongylonema pulchrum]|uniref:PAP-associated domain-containing protein n=1 Tax=Gongylonema pulchrum TaxID=637853 RepID=A0A183DM20_9BILA|nr:unnamed protein product [Gongylonema pulchrum]